MRKKTYRQNCSLAYSSDLLGERWTLLIFRELLIKPCRFSQLNQYLQGMGSNLLSARLKELEAEALIEKESPENKRSAYLLTERGSEVEPIVLQMIRWGFRHQSIDDSYLHFHHWDLLAMKALFKPENCKNSLLLQFDCPELKAWVKVSPTGFSFSMGESEAPDCIIPLTIREFRTELEKGSYDGDPELQAFVGCFDLTLAA